MLEEDTEEEIPYKRLSRNEQKMIIVNRLVDRLIICILQFNEPVRHLRAPAELKLINKMC